MRRARSGDSASTNGLSRVKIPHNWTPRDYQRPLLNAIATPRRTLKRAVCVWHRRAGKDLTALNATIACAALDRPGIYYHCLPHANQGRKVIWDGKDGSGRPLLDLWPRDLLAGEPNSTQMMLKTVNGSLWQIIGSDAFDNVMGTNPVGIVFSEFSLQDPRAWDYFRPILAENKGWAIFLYTPRGRNHGYDLWIQAQNNPDWFAEMLTVRDTNVLTEDEINAERRSGMSSEMIDQEFYCSFDAALPGAYYAQEMRRAREEGRITHVPIMPSIGVDTWWDLGMDDSTSIWFTQDVGREIHIISYYEARGEGLSHYAQVLEQRAKVWRIAYRKHTAPHDVVNRELGTGKSRMVAAGELGIKFAVAPKPGTKEAGIEATRRILPICWFDESNCRLGIDGLLSYRSEYDEVNRVNRRTPVHDWASHPADAAQTMALSHRFQPIPTRQDAYKQPARRGSWMSA